jgi:hypothetical protein
MTLNGPWTISQRSGEMRIPVVLPWAQTWKMDPGYKTTSRTLTGRSATQFKLVADI